MPAADALRVDVVMAWPDRVLRHACVLPPGATVADALAAYADAVGAPDTTHGVGIFGKPCDPSTPLRDGDRVELYRPLIADPKQARRERARR